MRVLGPIASAEEWATELHEGQFRKYTSEPYIVHPRAVARLVADHGGSPDMVAAAWLHDVVEDCNVTIDAPL